MTTQPTSQQGFDIDMFLAGLSLSYNVDSSSFPKEDKSIIAPKKRGARATKKTEKAEVLPSSAPKHAHSGPKPGSINAKEFFAAINKAGKRQDDCGTMVYVSDQVKREDERFTVQSYIGWDTQLSHGTNLDRARLRAQQETSKVVPRQYSRTLRPTFQGYVAGMPNETRKRLADLSGRLNKALDDLLLYEAASQDEDLPEDTRSHHAAMAKLEQERIDTINYDLRKLGF
jgi:hypothetical protein